MEMEMGHHAGNMCVRRAWWSSAVAATCDHEAREDSAKRWARLRTAALEEHPSGRCKWQAAGARTSCEHAHDDGPDTKSGISYPQPVPTHAFEEKNVCQGQALGSSAGRADIADGEDGRPLDDEGVHGRLGGGGHDHDREE